MAVLATQEFFQYLIWWDGTLALASPETPTACSTRAKAFSLSATLSAFGLVWVGLIRGWRGNPSFSKGTNRLLWWGGLWGWMGLVGGTLAAVAHANTWCARIGPNHHQQWVCSLAYTQIGGSDKFPWLLILYLVWYGASVQAAALTVPLPKWEFVGFVGVCTITAGTVYLRFLNTAEACSVWCWSAFTLGICFVFRPDLDKWESNKKDLEGTMGKEEEVERSGSKQEKVELVATSIEDGA